MVADDVVESSQFCSLSLSLATGRAQWGYLNLYRAANDKAMLLDTNYLCGFFQRQLALAAERALSARKPEAVAEPLAVGQIFPESAQQYAYLGAQAGRVRGSGR
jgi:hypothetical protein